jgi:hypothetical protein
LGEAILIVAPSVIKKGISYLEFEASLESVRTAASEDYQSQNHNIGVILPDQDEGGHRQATGAEPNEEELVDDGGV